MAKYMHEDATKREVAYNEILTFYFGEIARREAYGDYEGAHRTISSLEKSMAYLIDKQYRNDMDKLKDIKKPKGKSVAEIKRNEYEYKQKVMDAKHIALVNLAFRTGKLGHKVLPKSTQISEDEEYEQILS